MSINESGINEAGINELGRTLESVESSLLIVVSVPTESVFNIVVYEVASIESALDIIIADVETAESAFDIIVSENTLTSVESAFYVIAHEVVATDTVIVNISENILE